MYLSIEHQKVIYKNITVNNNLVNIILLYVKNKTSWNYIREYNFYIPKNCKMNSHYMISHYQNTFKQLIKISNKYINEDDIWNYFIPPTDTKILPLTNLTVRYWSKSNVIYSAEEKLYTYRLMYSADIYKNFKISLYPDEYVNSIGLYIDNFPISELIQINRNTFQLPGYFSPNQFMCYYLKFEILKIDNEEINENNRCINVEEIFLNKNRQELNIEKGIIF
jgi:hypothetical protein